MSTVMLCMLSTAVRAVLVMLSMLVVMYAVMMLSMSVRLLRFSFGVLLMLFPSLFFGVGDSDGPLLALFPIEGTMPGSELILGRPSGVDASFVFFTFQRLAYVLSCFAAVSGGC